MNKQSIIIILSILFFIPGCETKSMEDYLKSKEDTTPPIIEIINPTDNATYGAGILQIQGTCSDDKKGVAAVEISIDQGDFLPVNGTTIWYYELDTTLLDDGSHDLVIKAYDPEKNIAEKTISIIIDKVVPIPFLENTPTTPTTEQDINISVGNVNTYKCRLDNNIWSDEKNASIPITANDLQSGTHTLQIIGCNTIGVCSVTPLNYTWTVDTEGPVIAINSTSYISDFVIKGTCKDLNKIIKVEISFDKGEYKQAEIDGKQFSYDINSLVNGDYDIIIQATDILGNTGIKNDVTITVARDIPPPELSGTPDSPTSQQEINFTVSKVAIYQYSLNGTAFGAPTPAITPITATGLSEGENVLKVKGLDSIGNQTDVITYKWTIDITPPEITITNPENQGKYGNLGGTIIIQGTCSDNLTDWIKSVEISIDSVDEGAYKKAIGTTEWFSNPYQFEDGKHVINIKSTDFAGNTNNKEITIYIDNTIPLPVLETEMVSPTQSRRYYGKS